MHPATRLAISAPACVFLLLCAVLAAALHNYGDLALDAAFFAINLWTAISAWRDLKELK